MDVVEGTDKPTDSRALDRHAEYYFAVIIFLVENELFRVPRRNFEMESDLFSDMFQLPASTDGTPLDGLSDDRPIRLDGIKKSDFIQLLRVMFPLDSQSCNLQSSEWISVLNLSTMWQFEDIRTRAINALESLSLSMDLVDKILIARNFSISSWLVPSIHALVQREKPLDLSEGNRLGLEWALKVAEVREYGATIMVQNLAYPTCQSCSHSGPAVCNVCSNEANSCAYCEERLPKRASKSEVEAGGGRASMDCRDKIREIFGLE